MTDFMHSVVVAFLPVALFLIAIFSVEAIVNAAVHRDHPAYQARVPAVRYGQVLALIFGIVVWNQFARLHHLRESLLLIVFIVGSMVMTAIPVIATMIWKSRQAQH